MQLQMYIGFFLFFGVFFFAFFFKAALVAYGGSQARGRIRAVATYPRATATRIRATSATYTTAHGNAGSLTH